MTVFHHLVIWMKQWIVSQPARGDLGDPPVLDPQIQEFLSRQSHLAVEGMSPISLQCPNHPSMNPQAWVRWCACWEETLTWWPELTAVLQKGDVWEFAKRIHASFHMPRESYHTTNGKNDYLVPPTLHCLGCDNYLPQLDMRFGSHTKALQHWTEKVHEAVDHIHGGASSFQGSSITLSHGNPFLIPRGGRRGSSRIHKGKKQQVPESLPSGFNHPLPGMLQAPYHSCNSGSLHPNYSQPVGWCTKYFQAACENTSGKSHCMKADVTDWIHGNCQVLVDR